MCTLPTYTKKKQNLLTAGKLMTTMYLIMKFVHRKAEYLFR